MEFNDVLINLVEFFTMSDLEGFARSDRYKYRDLLFCTYLVSNEKKYPKKCNLYPLDLPSSARFFIVKSKNVKTHKFEIRNLPKSSLSNSDFDSTTAKNATSKPSTLAFILGDLFEVRGKTDTGSEETHYLCEKLVLLFKHARK